MICSGADGAALLPDAKAANGAGLCQKEAVQAGVAPTSPLCDRCVNS